MQNLMKNNSADTFCKQFKEVVNHYPDKTAVFCKGQSLTYEELDKWSGHLALRLISDGVKREDIIGVATGRSVHTLVAIIGIWKAGAAYLYLNPGFPATQLEDVQQQCRCPCIIDEAFLTGLDWSEPLRYDIDFSMPESLALLIFTSGTTAKPKGIMIEHRNIMAMNESLEGHGLTVNDAMCMFPSFSFVASVSDSFAPLLVGAAVYIIEEELRHDIKKIVQYFIEHGITVSFLPPVMAEKFNRLEQEETQLRLLLVGSDNTHGLTPRRYEIHHVYGSSEMCSLISDYVVKDSRPAYPIGKVKPGIKFYVIGSDGASVQAGQAGELWLSGPQVSRGYHCNPQKTSEQYGLNPFTSEPGYERIYKTRDIVRQLDDGDLMYLSRKDNMHKIRGYRVETGAVESVILQYPGIQNAVVKVFMNSNGDNILCGYFVSEQKLDPKQIKAFIRGHLPYYMVPTCMIQLEDFPRNLNEKINRSGFTPPKEINDHKLLEELY